jgi:hypothetical protein
MKHVTLILSLSLCACSMTKETYTEKRELRYRKGTYPHMKDFYNQPATIVQAQPAVDITHGDMPSFDNSTDQLESLRKQNAILQELAVNKALQSAL